MSAMPNKIAHRLRYLSVWNRHELLVIGQLIQVPIPPPEVIKNEGTASSAQFSLLIPGDKSRSDAGLDLMRSLSLQAGAKRLAMAMADRDRDLENRSTDPDL
jgi:hypothetical protein